MIREEGYNEKKERDKVKRKQGGSEKRIERK